MLEKLIEFITLKASIKLEINEHRQHGSYIESLDIDCDNKEVIKECLCQVEEYLLRNPITHEINNEFEKLEYYTSKNDTTTIHSIGFCSYNFCSLIRLLNIRKLLIEALHGCSGILPQVETGSWYALWYDKSIELTSFVGTTSENNIVTTEKKIESELNKRLVLKNTNYFAFRISNGVYSEPYILKISNGKIQEVICSTSEHTSTNLHCYLWKFIKKNNSTCKIHHTLPLKHNGDCTRYSDYALIQFQYLSEAHSPDQAFSLLSKNKPYKVDEKIFRDFQMASYFLGYDLIKKIIYPLPKDIAHQLSSKIQLKESSESDSITYKDAYLSNKKNEIERTEESKSQVKLEVNEFIVWINKFKKKRDELHQRYPKYSEDDTSNAYGAASQLINTLDTYVQQYNENKINLVELKQYSSREILIKRTGVLSQHRGIKEILANLLLAIGTIGIGYALGALLTQRLNPIKCNTDSANILDESIRHIHASIF